MRSLILAIGAMALAASAAAQFSSSGEADEAQSRPPAVEPTTPLERQQARSARREAGFEAARTAETCGDCSPAPVPVTMPLAQRRQEAAERYARVAALNRAGKLPWTTLYWPEAQPGT